MMLLLRVGFGCHVVCSLAQSALGQALTWQQVRDQFESANPTLRAGEINIAESRAQQITAIRHERITGSQWLMDRRTLLSVLMLRFLRSLKLLRVINRRCAGTSVSASVCPFDFLIGIREKLRTQPDRTTQRAYLTLVGSYLTVAAQLNLAVGREVIP